MKDITSIARKGYVTHLLDQSHPSLTNRTHKEGGEGEPED